MKTVDFCYWLQGFFELRAEKGAISSEQAEVIQRHLNMVFLHEIDPSYGGKQEQQKLNNAHMKPGATIPGSDLIMRC